MASQEGNSKKQGISITWGIIGFITLLLAATNPSLEDHRETVKKEFENKVDNDPNMASSDVGNQIGKALGESLGSSIIEKTVNRQNFLLFSLTTIKKFDSSDQDSIKYAGIGILGKVWIYKSKMGGNISSDNESAADLERKNKKYREQDSIRSYYEFDGEPQAIGIDGRSHVWLAHNNELKKDFNFIRLVYYQNEKESTFHRYWRSFLSIFTKEKPILISTISGLAFDSKGSLYLSESGKNQIIKFRDYQLGNITSFTILAGSGETGKSDGESSLASFSRPTGLALDKDDNLYVSDSQNNLIRKISPTGYVTTFAGSGKIGNQDGQGDKASFNDPEGLAIDENNNLFVADYGNHVIREITPTGYVSTFAGSYKIGNEDGSAKLASFSSPKALAFDQSGTLYVADSRCNYLRIVSFNGYVTTLKPTYKSYHPSFEKDLKLNSPQALTILTKNTNLASIGTIYVVVQDGIWEITPDGNAHIYAGPVFYQPYQ